MPLFQPHPLFNQVLSRPFIILRVPQLGLVCCLGLLTICNTVDYVHCMVVNMTQCPCIFFPPSSLPTFPGSFIRWHLSLLGHWVLEFLRDYRWSMSSFCFCTKSPSLNRWLCLPLLDKYHPTLSPSQTSPGRQKIDPLSAWHLLFHISQVSQIQPVWNWKHNASLKKLVLVLFCRGPGD